MPPFPFAPVLGEHGLHNAGVQQTTLDTIIIEIRRGNQNVEDKFQQLYLQLSQMRAEMVTRTEFETLTNRVDKLEATSSYSDTNEVKYLRQQLSKLDPCVKCIRINDCKVENESERTRDLEQILKAVCNEIQIVGIEHIYQGAKGARKISGLSIVAVSSRGMCSAVLSKLQGQAMKDKSR